MTDVIDAANEQAFLILERQIALAQKPIKPYQCEVCKTCIPLASKIKRWCEDCKPDTV